MTKYAQRGGNWPPHHFLRHARRKRRKCEGFKATTLSERLKEIIAGVATFADEILSNELREQDEHVNKVEEQKTRVGYSQPSKFIASPT